MIKIGKESRLPAAEVIDRAVEFFGPSGQGMNVLERAACCARFEGAGGHVFVSVEEDGKKGSEVTIEGREWEYQIKQFIGKV
ncbi:MAG: hypothetical protein ACOYYS_20575 [Chloroflexota bacterium]